MSNRNDQIITLLKDAIDNLDRSEGVLTEVRTVTDPETRIARLRAAITSNEVAIAALRQAQQTYIGDITVPIGVGEGDGSPLNLYVDIFAAPNENYNLEGTRLFRNDGTGYSAGNTVLNLTFTGRYKSHDNSGNFRFWYRVTFPSNGTPTVGWITSASMEYIRQNKPDILNLTAENLALLPEQDRDGTEVFTFYYTTSEANTLFYAPLAGNICLAPLQPGSILRASSLARNSPYLGRDFTYFEVRVHYTNGSVSGWIKENNSGLDPEEVRQALSIIRNDRTDEYGLKFTFAVLENRIPRWEMPPPFHFYPVSIAQTCAVGQAQGASNIDGLGVPSDVDLYGTPPYHPGTDFFVPEDSYVFSIASDGLVVGIGVGNPAPPRPILNTAYDWGSAILDDRVAYSVIIRYGHLFVLYGHLKTLESTIFVGAPISAGDRIGTIGKYNDPHVHIEVRNFKGAISVTSFQSGEEFRRYGFIGFSSTAEQRAAHHYDLLQLFAANVNAWSNDSSTTTQTISGFGSSISDGTQISIDSCTRTFQVELSVPTIFDPVLSFAVRGLVQGTSNQSQLVPPSAVPIR